MKYSIILLLPLLVFTCATEPQPIDYGEDYCAYCKMTIVDRQHAAELVTKKGRVYKFDAIECMLNYLDNDGTQAAFAHLLVNDYFAPGRLLSAQAAYYLISEAVPSPMGAYLSGFAQEQAARDLQQEKGGTVYNWENLLKEAHSSGLIKE